MRHLPDKTATIPCRNKSTTVSKRFHHWEKSFAFSRTRPSVYTILKVQRTTHGARHENTHEPEKEFGAAEHATQNERPNKRKISLYLYKLTFPNVRWQEIWVDITKLEEKKQLLAPAFLWEPVMDRHVTVTHQQGSTQNIEKVTQQQFFSFFFFEERFLHEDPHRFVLLISLFHQMKGMPWMSTPTPLPCPRIRCYPGKEGGGGNSMPVVRPGL